MQLCGSIYCAFLEFTVSSAVQFEYTANANSTPPMNYAPPESPYEFSPVSQI
jgi:hypothetical protein